jgi:hypothetical protein
MMMMVVMMVMVMVMMVMMMGRGLVWGGTHREHRCESLEQRAQRR